MVALHEYTVPSKTEEVSPVVTNILFVNTSLFDVKSEHPTWVLLQECFEELIPHFELQVNNVRGVLRTFG